MKRGGFSFEYELGPGAKKEIAEFFPGRIEEESFFREWKRVVSGRVADAGFLVESVEDYRRSSTTEM